jgi:hypothetical protein
MNNNSQRVIFQLTAEIVENGLPTQQFEEIKITKKDSKVLVDGQPVEKMIYNGFCLRFTLSKYKSYLVIDENVPKHITVSEIYQALK